MSEQAQLQDQLNAIQLQITAIQSDTGLVAKRITDILNTLANEAPADLRPLIDQAAAEVQSLTLVGTQLQGLATENPAPTPLQPTS